MNEEKKECYSNAMDYNEDMLPNGFDGSKKVEAVTEKPLQKEYCPVANSFVDDSNPCNIVGCTGDFHQMKDLPSPQPMPARLKL